MPTRREREYYAMGFRDGQQQRMQPILEHYSEDYREGRKGALGADYIKGRAYPRKPKRKLSAWNKYVKNKRNHITYRDGKLNLKKMGIAFRRKQRR